MGLPSPKTEQSSFLTSAKVAPWGSFSMMLLQASPTRDLHQLRLRSAAVMLLQSSHISKPLIHASIVSSSGLYLSYLSMVRQGSHRPTGSCTPELGRREEGLPRRVQDAKQRIPEFPKTSTNKIQNKMRGQ